MREVVEERLLDGGQRLAAALSHSQRAQELTLVPHRHGAVGVWDIWPVRDSTVSGPSGSPDAGHAAAGLSV